MSKRSKPQVQIVVLARGPGLADAKLRGHAVKLATITVDDKDKVLVNAARAHSDDRAAFVSASNRDQVARCIVAITEKPVGAAGPIGADVTWIKLSYAELVDPTGPKYVGALFTVPEWEVIQAWYRREHTVADADMDAILGKSIPVAEED